MSPCRLAVAVVYVSTNVFVVSGCCLIHGWHANQVFLKVAQRGLLGRFETVRAKNLGLQPSSCRRQHKRFVFQRGRFGPVRAKSLGLSALLMQKTAQPLTLFSADAVVLNTGGADD